MKNNKGFTLVELLVTISILGIITALAMPGVRRLTSTNNEKKFEAYEKSILSAAKLYVDDNAVDISFVSDCKKIKAEDLRDNNLVKEFNEDIKCLNCGNSYIMVKRYLQDGKYKYDYSVHLKCETEVIVSGTPTIKVIYSSTGSTHVC